MGYFYRREVQEAIGGFNEENHLAMDLEFLLEATRRYPVDRVEEILGVYRILEHTKSQQTSDFLSYQQKTGFVKKYLRYTPREYRKGWRSEFHAFIVKGLQQDLLTAIKANDVKTSGRIFKACIQEGRATNNARFLLYLTYLTGRRLYLKIAG